MPARIARTARTRVDVAAGTRSQRADVLAVEEPLEVRVDGAAVVVTMRTPGDDVDLALGFLLTEGLIASLDDVARAMVCSTPGPVGVVRGVAPTTGTTPLATGAAAATAPGAGNAVDVTLRPGTPPLDLEGRRTFGMTSACGVCGSASIDAVLGRTRAAALSGEQITDDRSTVGAAVLAGLPDALRSAQKVFERTGGLHAAGLFTADGTLLGLAEDVGRHNAVDKVLGRAASSPGWPLRGTVLQVSGRASFELVAKAAAAGVPVLSAVSAPSSLAVDLARSSGMTLAGFVRGSTFNVYCGGDRIV